MTRVRPRRPSRRAMRRGTVVSAAGALLLAAALVWQTAYAGFTDTTTALPASISSGTVAVTNETEGLATVTVPALRPGIEFTECIVVTSTGSARARVRLYAKDQSGTATGLTSNINFKVTAGTGGGVNDDCAGFVSNGSTVTTTLSSFPSRYAGGILPWDTAGGATPEKRTYRLTYWLSTSTPTSAKGASARVTLAWEAQQR